MDSKRRVLIDGHDLWLGQGTGIATYTRNLAIAAGHLGFERGILISTAPVSRRNAHLREVEFYDTARASPMPWLRNIGRLANQVAYFGCPPRVIEIPRSGLLDTTAFHDRLGHFERVYQTSDMFQAARLHFSLTGRRLKLRPPGPVDIAHWSSPIPIELIGAKNVYTLHDLVPLKLPHTTLDNKRYYLRLVQHLSETADPLITVSESSKKDIEDILPAARGRVSNTYQATDIDEGEPDGLGDTTDVGRRLKQLYNLEAGRYFLFIGAVEPKKNVGRLLQAFLSADCDLPLVMVGPSGWMADEELRLLSTRAVARRLTRVKQLGFVRRPALRDLIRGSRALLFPSIYEGFGLPVVEAMTLGTPVMTSNTSSMPETAGQAALYVDPYRVDEMRAAITRLAHDEALVDQLRRLGPVQAEKFSAARHAERLAQAYAQVLPDFVPPPCAAAQE
ncbi:MAG TPA: glycosyltransferase family 1 protein [Caulobacteraceae bacterium]|nr:glycosyltransferase family 1 protein [Caulobacteraceae bacterium]